jgi:hypothetical protein
MFPFRSSWVFNEATVTAAQVSLKCYSSPGLPDFIDTIYRNGGKCTKLTIGILLNGHRMYQMYVIHSNWPYNIPTFSIPRPSMIYPNWDIWFENIPSGNPAALQYPSVIADRRSLMLWIPNIPL